MNQGTNLGSQIGRWIILAAVVALLGALLLTIRPAGAQSNVVTHSGEVKEHSTDVVNLAALEPDRTQVADRWELVTDTDDPAYDDDFLDYRHFKIDRMSGVMTFKTPPDYENPMSAAAADATVNDLANRNVYKVKAKFGDGEKYLPVEVTVTVTGIEEDGTITLSNRRPQAGVGLTATLADPDKGIRTPDWQWQVETDEGTGVFEDIANAVNRTYTPQAGDVGKYLKATATYQDGHGIDYVEEEATSEFVVRPAPGSNDDPVFQEEDEDLDQDVPLIQSSRRIEENSAPGTKVGPAVKATDDDHLPAADPGGEPRDELTYSLRDPKGATGTDNRDGNDDDNDINTPSDGDGHAALFSIDQATGQITTKYPLLDRESLSGNTPRYAYSVVVRATDPSGAFEDMELDIYVLDVEETPELTGPAALTYFENSVDLLLDRNLDNDEADNALYRATDNDLDDGLDGPDADLLDGDAKPSADQTQIQWELTGPDASRFQFGGSTVTYTNSTAQISDADSTATPPTVAVATAPALQFRSAPNVEAPADVGGIRAGDNIYEITVRAWDKDWLIGSRDVTIRVADTDDAGTVTLSHITPQQGTAITATLNDPDGISGQVSWQWYTGGLDDNDGEPTGTAITGATSITGATTTYTPGTGDNSALSVKATYEDRGSRGQKRTAAVETENTVRENPITDATGENDAPKFYVDTVDGTAIDLTANDGAQRIKANETGSYVRYVLEGQHPINVRNSELAAREYDDTDADVNVAAAVKVFDGYFANETDKAAGELMGDGTTGRENLQFDLSGADAKYFAIRNDEIPSDQRGLISTKRALDFETKSTYTVMVTATDPAGAKSTATVTINALDQAEIEGIPGDQKRVWVNESVEFIDSLQAANPPDVNLGGLKWSLLTTNEAQTNPEHNRNSALSVDCQADTTNDRLCDDFRFSRFHTTNTNLLFAIGVGEQHDVPDFEMPADADTDNVYQVVVRVAFATLRSDGDANHPNPLSDEMDERMYLVRVVDVDEAPSFRGADSDQSIDENSDDDLPTIEINRDVGGSVTATDPEDTSMPDPNKKLTFTLSLPADYANMFHIVPSTGEILTRSRIDYEALDLEEQGTPGGQYKTISGVTVTVADSFNPEAYSDTRFEPVANTATIDVSINVRDVNETPIPVQNLSISGDAAVAAYAEMQDDTTVGSYTVSGDNVADAVWSRGGADSSLFTLTGTGMSRTLAFASAPDFETPADADMDNVYMVTLQVSDGAEDMASMAVAITVTNVDELGTLSGPETASINEGDTDLGTYMLTAIEGGPTVTWSVEGTDMSDFMLDMVEGSDMSRMLKFSSAPDYESPMGGADNDSNTYMVTVKASAGGEMEMMEVTVEVTNVEEDGTVTLSSESPVVGSAVTATLTDSDGGITGLTWTWETSSDMATWSAATGTVTSEGTTSTYTSVDDDVDDYLRAMASYTDGYDSGNSVSSGSAKVVASNVAPAFPSATATRSIAENTAANTNIGTPVAATDPNGDNLTYSLEGTDAASFGIVGSTGQLRTRAALNFETKSTYSVVVRATDSGRLSATTAVTINVTDVVEVVPEVPAIVQGYDTNGTPGIQISELFNAIDDYFAGGIITIAQLFEVIDAYFE